MKRVFNKRKTYLLIVFAVLMLCFFAIGINSTSKALANSGTNNDDIIINNKEQDFDYNDVGSDRLEVYGSGGKIENWSFPSETQNIGQEQLSVYSGKNTNFNERKIYDSNKPDSESIVVTIMGDGFTSSQQDIFINAAIDGIGGLLGDLTKGKEGVYPFNLFRDSFTVYAIEVISNESGVSRDADINNQIEVDNYFGSSFYEGKNKGGIARGLIIKNKSLARSLAKENSVATIIICNSRREGGSGGEFVVASIRDDLNRILAHELGHSLGGLADEYYYPDDENFLEKEAPNKTMNNNPESIIWKKWLGYDEIEIVPYSYGVDKTEEKYNSVVEKWFKPHKTCAMESNKSEFCSVCAEVLRQKMEETTGEIFNISIINNDEVQIDGMNVQPFGAVTFPGFLYDKKVVSIKESAFVNQQQITSVKVPSTMIKIADSAFKDCINLQKITIVKGVKIIGNKTFMGCENLMNVENNSIEVVGSEAFENCINLRRMNFDENIKIIEDMAFKGCVNLSDVKMLDTVEIIGAEAFKDCSELMWTSWFRNLKILGNNAFENCVSLLIFNSPTNLISIGARAFKGCKNLVLIGYLSSLQSIGEEAFMGCSWIESLESLSNLKTLGARAFKGCEKLATVEHLSGLEEIGEEAFYGCTKLTKILYARTLKSIGEKAFYNCNALTELDGTIALENIGEEAFFGCGQLRKIHTLNRLKTIDAGAFKGCVSFAETSLPAIERIEDEAFTGCTGLLNLTLGEDAKHIGARAFSGCNNLSRISWEGQLSNIGEEAFFGCASLVVDNLHAASIGARAFMNCTSITALAFPDAVSIGQEAFKGCTGLTSLCFARGNTHVSASIGARAFENCTNINEVVCDSFNVPTLGENCFPNNCGFTLLVPYNKSGEYTNIFAAYTSSVGYTTVRITLVCGGTESTKDVYYGQALGLSSFRKDGYLFRGWFGTADYKGQKRSLNEICTTKENFTLYGRLVSRKDIENYIAKLGTLADYYVQNGYESINSNTFSISDIAEYYRQRGSIYAGGELYKNIEVQEILTNVSHPYNIVVGNVGTSVREELEFIREHLGVCDNIYVTGLSLGTFLNSLGYELNNYADDALLDMARGIYNMAEARGSHIIFPTMFYAVSADYRTTAGLKSLDDIGANEAALFGIFPEMSTTGTLAVYGYSGFFTVEEYSVMSDEVKAEYENAARAFVREIENSKYNNVNKLFFGDTLRLCNENKYSFVSEKGRAPSLQNAIFQHLMVGGETINNITEIFRANPRAGERMLMRVECNIGYTDNRMDRDKFSKAISKCLPDIRWALESGCKVILMASNEVDKDDASDWQAKEFNNGRFLSEFSQAVGVEARFVSVDNIYDVLSDNCSVCWISNLYPYEKYYAFPSA